MRLTWTLTSLLCNNIGNVIEANDASYEICITCVMSCCEWSTGYCICHLNSNVWGHCAVQTPVCHTSVVTQLYEHFNGAASMLQVYFTAT